MAGLTVLRGGLVVDGTGDRPAFVADVHVRGAIISAVVPWQRELPPPVPATASEVVDCAGKR